MEQWLHKSTGYVTYVRGLLPAVYKSRLWCWCSIASPAPIKTRAVVGKETQQYISSGLAPDRRPLELRQVKANTREFIITDSRALLILY
jgi:hypothetical protein